jgi:pimeloyl-ACP methyl ester carboxylesterase
MTEIVNFSSQGWKLHGIVHTPAGKPERRVGVILLHENINTKFGTHQVFRQLADSLAQAGFFVLRFDDRGTCDSPGICDLTFLDRVADSRSAVTFFRSKYQLDSLIGWGLCLGASVAVHTAAELRRSGEKFDGVVLCSILADPSIVSLPKYGYYNVNLPTVLRDSFMSGNFLRKLREAPRKLQSYRENLPKLARLIFRRYTQREPALEQLRSHIARVGELLANHDTPCLLIFGEKDPYWESFLTRVNPDDRLGLSRKEHVPALVLVKDGDHTFTSREQTQEMIDATLAWVAPFQNGQLPAFANSYRGRNHAVSLTPVAD